MGGKFLHSAIRSVYQKSDMQQRYLERAKLKLNHYFELTNSTGGGKQETQQNVRYATEQTKQLQ